MSSFQFKAKILSLVGIVTALSLTSCASLVRHDKDRAKASIYLQMAADRFNNREYTKSLEAARQALELDPAMAPAYNHIALVYMEIKRYDKSEEAFLKALELQPAYPEVFNNFGVLQTREEKYDDAIKNFQKALADDKYSTPENAYTNLGYAYYKQGNLALAKVYHQKALDVLPQFCLASKNMGDVYAREKNYSKAQDYFQKAATNCPLYQEAQYKLGLILMKMGQRKVAKTQLEKLVERHKSGPYVERSNEVLKYLQ